jgi:hypothetical protein
MSLSKKRSKSLSLSEGLLRRLTRLWYDEVKKRLNRDERLSFSEFAEELLWDAMKRRLQAQKKQSRLNHTTDEEMLETSTSIP